MKYRDVYKAVCKEAAEHLYSLEIYDDFDEEDSEKVDRAISEIQRQLFRKSGDRCDDVQKAEELEEITMLGAEA